MGQAIITGTLLAGPPQVSSGTFPGASASVPISTREGGSGFQRATGVLQRTETYAILTDLGDPGHTVKKATLLYFRSDGPVTLKETQDDGSGGETTATSTVQGLVIKEYPSDKALTKLEMLGSATFELFLSGNQ